MNDDIRALQRDLIEGMTSYMSGSSDDSDNAYGDDSDEGDSEDSDFDAGYTQEHVDCCAEILQVFFDELSQVGGTDDRDAEIMEAVKTAVTELNALNEEADGNLIETDQREQLCEIINASAQEAGLSVQGEDLTEEWREW